MTKKTSWWVYCVILMGTVFWYLHNFVPIDMDEFSYYSPLGWWRYPNNIGYVNWPGYWDFRLSIWPGHWWPLRSYYYIGSLHALLYYPLFLIAPHPWSARLFGFAILIPEALVLARLTRLPSAAIFIGLLLYFPYSYQHAIDVGPVSLHCLIILTMIMIIEKDYERSPWLMSALLGFLFFLGIWEKLCFFWVVPSLVLWILIKTFTLLSKNFLTRNQVLTSAGIGSLTGLLPSLLLLFASDPWSRRYIDFALGMRNFRKNPPPWADKAVDLGLRLFNPLQTTERVLPSGNYDVLPWVLLGTAVFCLFFFVIIKGHRVSLAAPEPRERGGPVLIVGSLALFVISFFLMVPTAFGMHHVVLVFPFLIVSVVTALAALFKSQRKKDAFFGMLAITVSLCLYAPAWIKLKDIHPGQEDAKVLTVIHDKLTASGLSSSYAYIVLDWGYFHTQWVFGDRRQMVIGFEGLRQRQEITVLKTLLKESGRKALFISRAPASHSDIDLLKKSFSLVQMPGLPSNEPWQVLMEDKQ